MFLFCPGLVLSLPQNELHAQSPFDGNRSLVILNTKKFDTLTKAVSAIEKNGGHVVHLFPPNIMHAYLTPQSDSALKKTAKVKVITEKLYPIEAERYTTNQNLAIETWNAQFIKTVATRALEEKGDKDHGTQKAPDLANLNNQFILRGQKNFYLTSEYLVGTVAVGTLFVESDGTLDKKTEDWTLEDKIDAMRQIYKGLDWWAENGGYRASLTFVYDIIHLNTRYEPINRTKDESILWVNECMQELGYSGGEDYTVNREYINDLRDKYQTDWGFNIFMVPAANDDDGYFADQTGIAWAYLGGPYMVISSKCNGWGFNQVWKVVAHETGHIFNALDEYKGASSCDDKSGRLNMINGNHEIGGLIKDPCIMKASDLHICEYTSGQIGWLDSDSDGVFDSDYLNISKRFNRAKAKNEKTYSASSPLKNTKTTRYSDEENILLHEDFSARTGWYEDSYIYIKNGSYHMFDPEYGSSSWLDKPYDNFSATVKTKWLDGSSVSGYGIMFRIYGPNDSYLFYINGDGQYCAGKYLYGNWNYLKDWDRSDAISLNGENTLRVDCVNENITLYINGKEVAKLKDQTFSTGCVGLAVLPEVHVDFDDLIITKP